MPTLSNTLKFACGRNNTVASNNAIKSLTWQQGWDAQKFHNIVRQHIVDNGTRDLGTLFNFIRHKVVTYDTALNNVPRNCRDGKYDRVRSEVTEAVRIGITQAFIQFLDRYNVKLINEMSQQLTAVNNKLAELQQENDMAYNQVALAVNAIEALLTAPGVDETSEDYQMAYAQYEQLMEIQ